MKMTPFPYSNRDGSGHKGVSLISRAAYKIVNAGGESPLGVIS